MDKVAKNYIFNLSYQLLVLVVPLVTTPYISRVLGAKGVGVLSYTNSIVQLFVLIGCIGLNVYGQREIAYVQQDKNKRDIVFWEIEFLRVIVLSISLLVYLLTFAFHGTYSHLFIIMTFELLGAIVDLSWFFQGLEDFKKIVARNFVVKITGVLLIFLFVKTSEDIYLYALFQSATVFLGNLSMWAYAPKLIGRVKLKNLNPKKHIIRTITLFIPQIAISIYTILDKTMIGLLTGVEEEVAYYEQGQKIVKIAMTIITSLGTVMLPRIANLYKQNHPDQVRSYMLKSFRFAFFLSFPMTLGLMSISSNLVPWFFGEGYDKVIPNMVVISPIIVIMSLSNVVGTQYLLPLGRQKEYTQSVMIGCVVNCCLNLYFIPRMYSIGAAIATVIAESSVTAVQLIFVKKDFDFFRIIKDNIHYILSSLLMFFITYYLAKRLNPSFVNTCLCILVGIIVYFSLLILMKDEVIFQVRQIMKNKIKKFTKCEQHNK